MFIKSTVYRIFVHAMHATVFAAVFGISVACSDSIATPVQQHPGFASLYGADVTSDPAAVGALVDTITLRSFCTGTLISPRWIITAAHCVEDKTAGELLFTLSSDVHHPDEPMLPVVETVVHPDYRPITFINDIALLQLKDEVSGIEYPSINQRPLGESFLSEAPDFVGYGYDENRYSGVKRTAPIPVLSIGKATFSTIWRSDYETGACFGDSGGPAFLPEDDGLVLAGIVSNILSSDDDDPCVGSYNVSRVDRYAQWILENTDSSQEPTECAEESSVCFCDDACADNGATCDNARCQHLNCLQTYDCVDACEPTDGACMNDCYVQAETAGLAMFETFLTCGNDECGLVTMDDLFDCLYENCHDSFHGCFDATDCRLTGGECETGSACRPIRYELTTCEPSLDFPLGASCNPDSDQVSCADGLICARQSGNNLCSQLCFADEDCDGRSCLKDSTTDFRGTPISICEQDVPHVTSQGCGYVPTMDAPAGTLLRLIF